MKVKPGKIGDIGQLVEIDLFVQVLVYIVEHPVHAPGVFGAIVFAEILGHGTAFYAGREGEV